MTFSVSAVDGSAPEDPFGDLDNDGIPDFIDIDLTGPLDPQEVTPLVDYAYDTVGNVLQEKSLTGLDQGAAVYTTRDYEYNDLYLLFKDIDENQDPTLYESDRVGNLRTLTDAAGNATHWKYDDLDRVTKETNSLGDSRFYYYDKEDNVTQYIDRNGRGTWYLRDGLYRVVGEWWTEHGLSGAPANELWFNYDVASQLENSSDAAHAYEYQYDELGRVAQSKQRATGLAPKFQLDFEYDLMNNRTRADATIGNGKAPSIGSDKGKDVSVPLSTSSAS